MSRGKEGTAHLLLRAVTTTFVHKAAEGKTAYCSIKNFPRPYPRPKNVACVCPLAHRSCTPIRCFPPKNAWPTPPDATKPLAIAHHCTPHYPPSPSLGSVGATACAMSGCFPPASSKPLLLLLYVAFLYYVLTTPPVSFSSLKQDGHLKSSNRKETACASS